MNRNVLILFLFFSSYAMDTADIENVDRTQQDDSALEIEKENPYAPFYLCCTCYYTTVFRHNIEKHTQEGHHAFAFIPFAKERARNELFAALARLQHQNNIDHLRALQEAKYRHRLDLL